MSFRKLYFDHASFESFCHLSIREGWISRFDGEFDEREGGSLDSWFIEKPRVTNKSALLLNLTLFEQIDTVATIYDMQKFIDEGLINRESKMFDYKTPHFLSYGDTEFKKLAVEDQKKIVVSWESSQKILSIHIEKIARYLLRNYKYQNPTSFYDDFIPSESEVIKYLDSYINENWKDISKRNFYENMKNQIDFMEEGLASCIFNSMKENVAFTSIFNSPTEVENKKQNLIENANYIVRTKLSNESLIFPFPKNLDDVMRMRNRKELIRFREVLYQWILSLQNGEANLEAKMRKDISKANKELKNLSAWREYKDSPINFWLNSIGGHIPILGNILTIVSMLGGLYEGHLEKKCKWIKLVNIH